MTVPSTIQALLAARLDQLPAVRARGARARLGRGTGLSRERRRGARAGRSRCPVATPRARPQGARPPSAATLPGDDAFRFRHLLIRDAAYDALPKASARRAARALRGLARGACARARRARRDPRLPPGTGGSLSRRARQPSPALEERSARHLAAAGRACRASARTRPPSSRSCAGPPRSSSRAIRDARSSSPSRAQALYALGRLEEAYAHSTRRSQAPTRTSRHGRSSSRRLPGASASRSPRSSSSATCREVLAPIEETASDETVAAAYPDARLDAYWQGRLGAATEAGERAVVRASRARKRSLELEALRLGQRGDPSTATCPGRGRAMGSAECPRWSPTGSPARPGRRCRAELEEARRIFDQHDETRASEDGCMSALHAWRHRAAEIEMAVGEYDLAEEILRPAGTGSARSESAGSGRRSAAASARSRPARQARRGGVAARRGSGDQHPGRLGDRLAGSDRARVRRLGARRARSGRATWRARRSRSSTRANT